ncbi:EAL domain-containing protein [Kineococcus gynurae]|uniref:EAL domain-containing protein n=1 Tax=Kineococcus gynurae TaxID=452979 RepID=A0ABV5LP17_9ACTN
MSDIADILARDGIRPVFQPIVELTEGRVLGYEALARGPVGPLHRPDDLFARARVEGRLAELDEACRRAAFTGALREGVLAPLALFVNVEPEVLGSAPLSDLLELAAGTAGELQVVVEITERALAARPAELLRAVDRVRELGWRIALDDVGAEPASLAFMPLLAPDVVKLDLRLVQDRPGPAVAQIMNAVNAYAESSGALILAEGIEHEGHLSVARSLGASIGQGWLFGRPEANPAPRRPAGGLVLPRPVVTRSVDGSPFALVDPSVTTRFAAKSLLIEVSKQLEREAARLGDTCIVAATFQEARHFTPATVSRYRELVERTNFVCALGEGMSEEPLPGLRGASLELDDPIRGEWDVVVLAPHFSAALLARDLGADCADRDRPFEYVLTYDRDTVVAAARSLLARVAPRLPVPGADVTGPAARPAGTAHPPLPSAPFADAPAGAARVLPPVPVLHAALDATTSGIAIADARRPDLPLIYVNSAFERLAGFPAADLLGRNCRFLQSADTDRTVVDEIRAAIAAGREWRGVLQQRRGGEQTSWWNEIHLSPVLDGAGRVAQYVGVQNDVTQRIEAEQSLAREQDRARGYLARIEALAWSDPLTGLANRRRIEEAVEEALTRAGADGSVVVLLYCDLDGFKGVNDGLGHAAGDEVLVEVARRTCRLFRGSDLAARLGGDEFLVALTGIDPVEAPAVAHRAAETLRTEIARPLRAAGRHARVGVSVGTAISGRDGMSFGTLLHVADGRMFVDKAVDGDGSDPSRPTGPSRRAAAVASQPG